MAINDSLMDKFRIYYRYIQVVDDHFWVFLLFVLIFCVYFEELKPISEDIVDKLIRLLLEVCINSQNFGVRRRFA